MNLAISTVLFGYDIHEDDLLYFKVLFDSLFFLSFRAWACFSAFRHEGLKASFYFSLWERPYGFVKYIAPIVEINSGYSADLML
jgi:hypothetical protein